MLNFSYGGFPHHFYFIFSKNIDAFYKRLVCFKDPAWSEPCQNIHLLTSGTFSNPK